MSTVTDNQIPLCPACDGLMVKRRSGRGEFWGCQKFPVCRGTRTVNTAADPDTRRINLMPGSEEQEAIWNHLLNGTEHTVVEAVAGSGKTYTAVQACLRLPKTLKAGFLAFNKHIATEAQSKLRDSGCGNVTCCTYHSLGLRTCRTAWPNVQIDERKTEAILESLDEAKSIAPQVWRTTTALTAKLVGFVKNYLLDPGDPNLQERLEELCEHHAVEMNGAARKAMELVPQVVQESIRRSQVSVDFDDMIWLPVHKQLPAPVTFDILMVDEYQDSNLTQQELAMRFCPNGRLVVIGDRNQSLYGFRGADVTAIPRAIERLGATERGVKIFPLTATRRCPQKHVAMAQAIVPQIRALETAPEGEVLTMPEDRARDEMLPGDLVLCRVNARLVQTAYALLRRGVKAVIRGRDIGKGLIALIEKLERKATDVPGLLREMREYRYKEEGKLMVLGNKGGSRLLALRDKCDCLEELASGCSNIMDLKMRIETLFADFEADGTPRNAVVLGTVHRTKGLEAGRVFVLAPELLPHPMAKQEWEQTQERNIAYVAVTRAKYDPKGGDPGTLVFCGLIPSIFSPVKGEPA